MSTKKPVWVTRWGFRLRRGSKAWLWAKRKFDHALPRPKPAPAATVTMFDDVNLALIPQDAEAVAGYVDGHWANYTTVVRKWPHAKHLSIAVFAKDNADALDVEPGDATISEAAAWVKRQHKRGIQRIPVLYTSAANGARLVAACSAAGLVYGKDYQWWSAHYDVVLGKHFCGPKCGFGLKVTAHATQWTDRSHGRSLDESVCSEAFFT